MPLVAKMVVNIVFPYARVVPSDKDTVHLILGVNTRWFSPLLIIKGVTIFNRGKMMHIDIKIIGQGFKMGITVPLAQSSCTL